MCLCWLLVASAAEAAASKKTYVISRPAVSAQGWGGRPPRAEILEPGRLYHLGSSVAPRCAPPIAFFSSQRGPAFIETSAQTTVQSGATRRRFLLFRVFEPPSSSAFSPLAGMKCFPTRREKLSLRVLWYRSPSENDFKEKRKPRPQSCARSRLPPVLRRYWGDLSQAALTVSFGKGM